MSSANPSRSQPSRSRLRHGAGVDLASGLVATALAAAALEALLDVGGRYLLEAVLVYLLMAAGVYRLLPPPRTAATLGPASRVTLVRVVLTALVAGGVGASPSSGLAWTLAGVALVAVALDGVDGWLARRFGVVSRFGARFDMETDALLILVLCVLAWRWGHAGAWVLLAGALRYLFVAAGALLPWLSRPLPPSRRRQTVCVLQTVTLLACVAPWPGPPLSAWLAGAGLLLLCYSFTADTLWLARRDQQGREETPS